MEEQRPRWHTAEWHMASSPLASQMPTSGWPPSRSTSHTCREAGRDGEGGLGGGGRQPGLAAAGLHPAAATHRWLHTATAAPASHTASTNAASLMKLLRCRQALGQLLVPHLSADVVEPHVGRRDAGHNITVMGEPVVDLCT